MTATKLNRDSISTAQLVLQHPPAQTGIVHLGLGNFHRAHQAVHTAHAMAEKPGPWGILGVASKSSAVADAMRNQDQLYSVVEISPHGNRVTVPGVHTGTLVAQRDPGAVLQALAKPATKIVTITVTEHGYTFSAETGALDVDSAAVRADLAAPGQPRTTIGQIATALVMRAETHGAPVTILSCDNLLSNGDRTRQLVRQFVSMLPSRRCADVLAWIDSSVTFPNSMVDRIVPASADQYNAIARRALGVRDAIAVPAEPFSMWVMQNEFAAGRPAWEYGGAVFTDDVEPFELMKLRLLNGTHSLIAYLGALDGRATIPDSVARPFIEQAAREVLSRDYLPTVPIPATVDIGEYTNELFDRWTNTALGHRTAQVGSDGSVKLPQRIPKPALEHLDNGVMPHHLALTVAAYLCCVAPRTGFDPGPDAAAMTDPARPRLAGMAGRTGSTREFVQAVFHSGGLFPSELASRTTFVERVAQFVDIIVRHGPAAAAAEAGGATTRLAFGCESDVRSAI
jgi:fructuronate reductase